MTQENRVRIAELSDDERVLLVRTLQARRPERSTGPGHYDVAIMGGGVAGLTLALHLRKTRPNIRVLVVERQRHPVPETAHKVGESTVEIAAHYLRDTIGLAEHLATRHIRKFGLRMFFSGQDNTDIAARVELGSSEFPTHATYQLDRGRLENELGELCDQHGIDLVTGGTVQRLDLDADQPYHHLRVAAPEGERDVHARWVVDATGRNHLMQRKLSLRKRVDHAANAAWFRVGHPIDIGTWTDDADWHERIVEGRRELSTNHLMGPGYWVWLIRLASGSISVGIVAEAGTHRFDGFNTLDRALNWLSEHEPQCWAEVSRHRDKVQDFRVMKDYAYSCDRVFDGRGRWCLTGEAGIFLDPLYSPGLDLIAISNGLVVDLVNRSLDGQDVSAAAAIHDALFRRITDMWMAIYENQYSLMGNARVMSSKVIWDTAFYWGVFGLLFFQDQFRTVAGRPTVTAGLARLTDISNRVQAFFREWASVDHGDLPARFVDLYSPLNFMVKLHNGLADELSDAQFDERFSANVRLFEQLAGQLVTTVIDAHHDRYDDDPAVAQIQAWQRDPLLGELVATYRKERHRNPTSEGWMVLDAADRATQRRERQIEEVSFA